MSRSRNYQRSRPSDLTPDETYRGRVDHVARRSLLDELHDGEREYRDHMALNGRMVYWREWSAQRMVAASRTRHHRGVRVNGPERERRRKIDIALARVRARIVMLSPDTVNGLMLIEAAKRQITYIESLR